MSSKVFSFEESVAKRLEKMTRQEALLLGIGYMGNSHLVDTEAARRLLIVMRNELIGGNRDDNNQANVPYV